jgi:hypothetical protein
LPPHDVAPLFVVTLLALVTGSVLILRGPLGKALARRIEGNQANPEIEARVQDLEIRIGDAERERGELAERLEFAERLLLQAKETPRELGSHRELA